MTSILPLVQKAWEKEEFFISHEVGFIPNVCCVGGTCLLPDPFFPSQVFGCLCEVHMARGPTQEQFLKDCSLWEGPVLEKFMKDVTHGMNLE